MSALSIQVPFPVFQDRDGQPLENGFIFLGVANLNPQTNPVTAFFDDALTIPAAQPLRTINGFISNAGTPAQVYVDGVDFSILVKDSKGSTVYNFPEATGISPDACGVIYNPPYTGGVAIPVCEKLAQTVSVKDFGAVGDGVTDDTAAIQLALNSTATKVVFTQGTYRIANDGVTTDPALTSTVNNRIICGAGIITATTQVKRALRITGNDTVVDGIRIDGNGFIGYAIEVVAENPTISNCYIHNLNGFNNWGGIAIRLNFDGLDTTALITNNTIKNLQGVGDGIGGNGIGMQRAVTISSDQNCTKQILVCNNIIDQVEGEEGDSLVVISSDGVGARLDMPVVFQNNTINLWTRRAVKIQANKVSVLGNSLSNNRSVNPGTLQRAIDIVQGADITVSNNTLKSCKFQGQIGHFENVNVRNNFTISGNSIEGLGSETTSNLIALSFIGNNGVVANNIINCPNFAGTSINVGNFTDGYVVNNTIISNNRVWFAQSGLTDVFFNGNVASGSFANFTSFYDIPNLEYKINTTITRTVVLQNVDNSISDEEIVSAIACRQNDDSFPDQINASVKFIGVGAQGDLRVAICAGGGAAPDVEVLSAKPTGQTRFVPLAADPINAQAGDVYYNSVTNKLRCFNGTSFNDLF